MLSTGYIIVSHKKNLDSNFSMQEKLVMSCMDAVCALKDYSSKMYFKKKDTVHYLKEK